MAMAGLCQTERKKQMWKNKFHFASHGNLSYELSHKKVEADLNMKHHDL